VVSHPVHVCRDNLLIADPHFGKSTLPDLSTEAVFLADTKRKSALYNCIALSIVVSQGTVISR
jgi:hypothetical protein